MRGHIIGYVETPGVGDNSYEGEVEFTGVDAEIEEEDMEMTDMETEGNFNILGVDMEQQDPSLQVVDIKNTEIPQDPSIIAPEVPDESDGPVQVSTLATEGPRLSMA